MEAAEFMKAMQRFVDIRGKPSDVYFDNGRNFRAADRDLRQVRARLMEETSQRLITHWTAQQDIIWHFIPARAPHFEGLWEASVKKMKLCFWKVISLEKLTLSELLIVLSSASASLNSNLVETLQQRLWKRWSTEYLASLKAYNHNRNRYPRKDLKKR